MKSIWLCIAILASVATVSFGDDSSDDDIVVAETEKPEDTTKAKIDHGSGIIEDRERLINSLLSGYDKRNYPTNMTVNFGLYLRNYDIDEDRDSLEADVWLRYMWHDSRLHWDKKDFDVGVIRLPSDQIWKPDTALYNSLDVPGPEMMKCWDSNILIYPNGNVLWVPPCHVSAHCNHNLDKDPFGPQKCYLQFGSWTFDAHSMGLDFYKDKLQADIKDNLGSRHWDLISNTATREVRFYECCTEPYVSLIYNLTLQRKADPSSECRL